MLTSPLVIWCISGEGFIWKQLHPALAPVAWLRLTVGANLVGMHHVCVCVCVCKNVLG